MAEAAFHALFGGFDEKYYQANRPFYRAVLAI
jgi:hypothetical protein